MTPKNNKRAVSRRARQNKSPNGGDSIASAKPTTALWSVYSGRPPFFNNVMRLDSKAHRFVQTTNLGVVITSSNSLSVAYSKSFSSADITQFSSFSAIFDQYKISLIEVWLSPSNNGVITATGISGSAQLYTITDYDDANSLSTPANAMNYTNVMVASAYADGHYRRWRPHIAVAAYGGAFTQFKNVPADWIDVASTSVQHYGFKSIVEPTATGTTQAYVMVTRLHIDFRNTI